MRHSHQRPLYPLLIGEDANVEERGTVFKDTFERGERSPRSARDEGEHRNDARANLERDGSSDVRCHCVVKLFREKLRHVLDEALGHVDVCRIHFNRDDVLFEQHCSTLKTKIRGSVQRASESAALLLFPIFVANKHFLATRIKTNVVARGEGRLGVGLCHVLWPIGDHYRGEMGLTPRGTTKMEYHF